MLRPFRQQNDAEAQGSKEIMQKPWDCAASAVAEGLAEATGAVTQETTLADSMCSDRLVSTQSPLPFVRPAGWPTTAAKTAELSICAVKRRSERASDVGNVYSQR